jgi:hypothetical protein
MAKVQSYLPFDCSTVTNYKAWAQGIGNALSTLGWSRSTDEGQVTWANVTQVAQGLPTQIAAYNFDGAWSGGTAYPAMSKTTSAVVTSGGLTYVCVNATQYTAITNVIENATSSTLSTAVTVSGTSVTYAAAVSGATTNSLVGQVFTASGGSVAANNVAYAVCISNTNAAVVLQFSGAIAQSTGTLPTLVSSNANFSVGYAAGSTGASTWAANALAGMSVITAGFTGNTNANGTFTVLGSSYDASTNAYVAMAYVSAPSTGSGYSATLTMNTAPASDLATYQSSTPTTGHWLPYNYEVWESQDSLSSVSPIYIRLLYLAGNTAAAGDPTIYVQIGTASSGYGYLTANLFLSSPNLSNNGIELALVSDHSTGGGANSTYECDFSQYQGSFGMILWRNATNGSACALIIDRAKDNYGNDLSTYEMVLAASSVSVAGGEAYAQAVYAPGGGSNVPTPLWGDFYTTGWPTIATSTLPGLALAGLAPTLPIFPVLGYVANPCLQAMAGLQGDWTNGQIINAVLYGAEHTFLVGYVEGPISSQNQVVNTGVVMLRWD